MLHIQTPPNYAAERAYTTSVLCADWLDIPYTLTETTREDVSIHLVGQRGEILLPDIFFSQAPATRLTTAFLPKLPLTMWDSRALAPEILLTDPRVPVLFGGGSMDLGQSNAGEACTIRLPIDLNGSAFFMLSRYEEAVLPDRDSHDCFLATASPVYRAGFLDRPVIDEYVEILWTAMQRLWPGLKRKPRQPRMVVNCDVDSPLTNQPWQKTAEHGARLARGLAVDLLRRRSPALAWRN